MEFCYIFQLQLPLNIMCALKVVPNSQLACYLPHNRSLDQILLESAENTEGFSKGILWKLPSSYITKSYTHPNLYHKTAGRLKFTATSECQANSLGNMHIAKRQPYLAHHLTPFKHCYSICISDYLVLFTRILSSIIGNIPNIFIFAVSPHHIWH